MTRLRKQVLVPIVQGISEPPGPDHAISRATELPAGCSLAESLLDVAAGLCALRHEVGVQLVAWSLRVYGIPQNNEHI